MAQFESLVAANKVVGNIEDSCAVQPRE